MKKNLLTKLMLIAVILCLAIALFACGGKKDNSKTKKEDDTPKQTEETTSIADSLKSIAQKADSLLGTISGISNKVSVDAGVGFAVTYDEKNYKGNLYAKGNLAPTSPELQVGVDYNDKDYFAIGYANKTVYLLEGLNMINTTKTSSNKIAMDITAISDVLVDNTATVLFKYLTDVTGGLKNINLSELIDSLIESLGKDMIDGFEDMIKIKEDANGATLTLNGETIASIWGLVGTMISEYTGYVDSALAYLGVDEGTLGVDSNKALTVNGLINDFLDSIEIKVLYKNGTISGLTLDINFKQVKLSSVGLRVNLNTLSTESKVTMDFSGYTAQDLSATVGLDLGNGYSGKLTCEAYTSNAFAREGNPMAAVKLAVKNGDNEFKNGFATFNGKDLFIDVSAVAEELGLIGYETAYKWSVPAANGKDSVDTVIKYINEYAKITYDENWQKTDEGNKDNKDKKDDDSSFDIWDFVYDIIADITDSEAVEENKPKTIDEAAVVKLIRDELGKYTLFIEAGDKSLSDIVGHLKTFYEANKDLLTGSLTKPTTDSYVAGIQLIAPNYNAETAVDALTFVSKFIKIANVTTTGKVLSGTTETTGNPYELGETATVITPSLLVDWVKWLFGMNYDKAAAGEVKEGEDYVWWDFCNVDMIEGLTGSTLEAIFNTNGLYAGAGTVKNGGLQGYVVLAPTAASNSPYVKLSGSIGFVALENNARIVAEATSAGYNTNGILITDKIGEEGGDAEAYVTVKAAYSPEYPITDLAYGAVIKLVTP